MGKVNATIRIAKKSGFAKPLVLIDKDLQDRFSGMMAGNNEQLMKIAEHAAREAFAASADGRFSINCSAEVDNSSGVGTETTVQTVSITISDLHIPPSRPLKPEIPVYPTDKPAAIKPTQTLAERLQQGVTTTTAPNVRTFLSTDPTDPTDPTTPPNLSS